MLCCFVVHCGLYERLLSIDGEAEAVRFFCVAFLLWAVTTPTLTHAFDTLDGDATKWPRAPRYSIGRLADDLAIPAQLNAIRESFRTWANVPGMALPLDEVAANGAITVDFLDRWPAEFGRYAAGVTVTSRRFGRITQAVISMNEQNFTWTTTPNGDGSDVQGVMTHEIGHALGLGHSFYRTSTMYWSDTGADLRNLSPDDERGIRFLYANQAPREGQMCDHCDGHDDCVDGAFCLQLEDDRSFCGSPCAGGCPEHAGCYELGNGQTTCAPLAGGCSDEPFTVIEFGEYCFGAEQCGANATCLVLPNTARCAQNCRVGRNDCAEGMCFASGDDADTGICLAAGRGRYNDACDSDFECAALACLPAGAGRSVCAGECDPDRDNCPDGPCVAVEANGLRGICIPPGQQQAGEPCSAFEERCANDLICVTRVNGRACRPSCVPFGSCAGEALCAPVGGDQWACLPATGARLGEACAVNGDCSAGLTCIGASRGRPGLCSRICDLDDPSSCGAAYCVDYGLQFGACTIGDRPFGGDCDNDPQCSEGRCVWTPSGNQCSRPCTLGGGDCPEGWDCQEYLDGLTACFQSGDETPSAGDAGRPNSLDAFVMQPIRPDASMPAAQDLGGGPNEQLGPRVTDSALIMFEGDAGASSGNGFIIVKPTKQTSSCSSSPHSQTRTFTLLLLILCAFRFRRRN